MDCFLISLRRCAGLSIFRPEKNAEPEKLPEPKVDKPFIPKLDLSKVKRYNLK